MAVLLIVVTAMSWYILAESSFYGECLCLCDVKFDQKQVTPEEHLDVSVDELLVLKLRWGLKPDFHGMGS